MKKEKYRLSDFYYYHNTYIYTYIYILYPAINCVIPPNKRAEGKSTTCGFQGKNKRNMPSIIVTTPKLNKPILYNILILFLYFNIILSYTYQQQQGCRQLVLISPYFDH